MKMRANRLHPRQSGVTLIELVISIVIISIGVTGILQVMSATTSHSADPMVREQAQLIGEAYMEEILLKAFVDPSTLRVCTPAPGVRTTFNKICDYNGLTNAVVQDQFGTPIVALTNYTVTVTVTPNLTSPTTFVDLNGIQNDYVLVPNRIRVLKVDVSVIGPNGTSVALTGYRTDYDCVIGTGIGCSPL